MTGRTERTEISRFLRVGQGEEEQSTEGINTHSEWPGSVERQELFVFCERVISHQFNGSRMSFVGEPKDMVILDMEEGD